MNEPRERLRKPNFTPDQIRVLLERVVAHGPQLYGEKVSPVSVRKRIWQEVTRAINEISHTERSLIEVQRRWQDERRRIKQRAQDLRRALAETGVPAGQLTPLEEAVMTTFDEAGVKEPIGEGTAGMSPIEQPAVSQHDTPVPSPAFTPTPATLDCVEDIKQEPSEPERPEGGDDAPQKWRFEWTAEDTSVALPTSEAPLMAQQHSKNSTPWRRRLRLRQRRAADRHWAGLTACLRNVASSASGLRSEVRVLSANILALRSELGALVGAVTAVASALQDHYSNEQSSVTQQNSQGRQVCTLPSTVDQSDMCTYPQGRGLKSMNHADISSQDDGV
ncbi:hypothetical protein MATL_G00086100 [Megalops atlanticus]|uniref:Myb/SANT-like DNA-binding domain-containing protein n=1 Tax=Megalops atlanticus TaxID=7932 RepID=A0A9D3Q2S9_MEGAT|nr:hypothetical protein MATL_G00086100 [Megalops atlanticus]